MASPDQEDKEDQRDPGVREDPGDQQENQEPRVHREVTDLQVVQERGDCPGLKEPMASPDQRDLPDLQEKMGFPDTLAREEKLGSKARLVHLGLLEWLDLRVPLERLAPWASVATLDPRVHQESRACLAPLVKRAPRETQVLLAAQERTDPMD